MSVYFIGMGMIRDKVAFLEYSSDVQATFTPFGGVPLARGIRSHDLTGKRGPDITIIVRFPDFEAVDAWYESDAYQALIPTRDRALDLTITVFGEPV